MAAAATLKQEYTLPGVTQTVIITRAAGKTPVPERENLKNLAKLQTTLCIFLSISFIENVVADLLDAGLDKNTPVAVVQKASWQDEKVLRGTLENIAEKVTAEKIERTALIIVGDCLNKNYEKSQLYSPKFSHMFRLGRVE